MSFQNFKIAKHVIKEYNANRFKVGFCRFFGYVLGYPNPGKKYHWHIVQCSVQISVYYSLMNSQINWLQQIHKSCVRVIYLCSFLTASVSTLRTFRLRFFLQSQHNHDTCTDQSVIYSIEVSSIYRHRHGNDT